MSSSQTLPSERLALEEASTADLIREVVDEVKELIKVETQIAQAEVKHEIKQAKRAAIALGIALAAAALVLSLLAVALVLALGATPVAALGVAGCLLVLGAIAGLVGYSMLPMHPLERTRQRLKTEVIELKEHIV